MPPSNKMAQEDFHLYNYRLITELAAAKLREEPNITFSGLLDKTGIEPQELSYILRKNINIRRIKSIRRLGKPIGKYSILPPGVDYFVALNQFISYLLDMHNAKSATDEIIVEASKLADILIKAPKIYLDKHR